MLIKTPEAANAAPGPAATPLWAKAGAAVASTIASIAANSITFLNLIPPSLESGLVLLSLYARQQDKG
jgi:hypothetical protein